MNKSHDSVDKSCDTMPDLLREPKRDPSQHVLKFVTESMFISELTIEIVIQLLLN